MLWRIGVPANNPEFFKHVIAYNLQMQFHRNSQRAFTLIELLIVIAVIAVLVGLVVVAAGSMLKKARSTRDMGNHRALGSANWSHSVDNNGKMLHPRTGGTGGGDDPTGETQHERMWIMEWGNDSDGYARMVNTGGEYIEMQTAIKDGAAYPYIGDVTAFQSPLDPTIGDLDAYLNASIHQQSGQPRDRIRSYAVNAFIGCLWGADDMTTYRDNPPLNLLDNGYWFSTETVSQIPQPGNTMFSIGEQDSWGRNGHGWLISPRLTGNPESPTYYWLDFPAFWDDRRANISYIDGSTGYIPLENEQLVEAWRTQGHEVYVNYARAESEAIRRTMLPGRITNFFE